jgi:Fe-S cluster assembly ATP-binding protein
MHIEIKDLEVLINDKKVLNKLNLEINPGEIHVIMGPNGVGKSTLSKVLMGSEDYKVEKGDILVDGNSIKNLKTDERAKLGMFLSFQNPIDIEGVTNSEFLKVAINERREEPIGLYDFIKEIEQSFDELDLKKEMMHRSVNQNFSGGEKKKNEILQMKLLKPKFVILDELDSGLDVDSLRVVCDNVNSYLNNNPNTSVLMITHYQRILDYIKPDYIHILTNGHIVKTGDATLAKEIEEKGYKSFDNCVSLVSED